jgi:hypothetical protein
MKGSERKGILLLIWFTKQIIKKTDKYIKTERNLRENKMKKLMT